MVICILVLEVETKLSSNLISPAPFCYTAMEWCNNLYCSAPPPLLYNYYIPDA